ncbi:MAG: fasciclin domain-containing protein [Phototrophicaceae bacterium]
MSKVFAILSLVVVLAFGAVAFAQDATIAEIVVASAEAEEPEFTFLLAAIGGADPAILEALADPESEYTVFAPTDAAFMALAEALGEEEFTAILEDPDMLTAILLYHVSEGTAMSTDVVGMVEGSSTGVVHVGTLNGQYHDIQATEDGGIMIDQANLVLEMVDIEASNGVIHVIDAVLLPELRTLAEVVVGLTESDEPEFSTLLGAVGLADPAILEALSDPESELTVFAPTDAAFAALQAELGDETFLAILEDSDALSGVLLYHVVDGIIHSGDIAEVMTENPEGFYITTLLEEDLEVTATEEGTLLINGITFSLTDVDAINGVIHVIDAVLVPAAE